MGPAILRPQPTDEALGNERRGDAWQRGEGCSERVTGGVGRRRARERLLYGQATSGDGIPNDWHNQTNNRRSQGSSLFDREIKSKAIDDKDGRDVNGGI